MEWILENWAACLTAALAIAKIIANLTPTETDNVVVFGWLDAVVNALVPNKKKPSEPNNVERRG